MVSKTRTRSICSSLNSVYRIAGWSNKFSMRSTFALFTLCGAIMTLILGFDTKNSLIIFSSDSQELPAIKTGPCAVNFDKTGLVAVVAFLCCKTLS